MRQLPSASGLNVNKGHAGRQRRHHNIASPAGAFIAVTSRAAPRVQPFNTSDAIRDLIGIKERPSAGEIAE
jgi:hypothetical protein